MIFVLPQGGGGARIRPSSGQNWWILGQDCSGLVNFSRFRANRQLSSATHGRDRAQLWPMPGRCWAVQAHWAQLNVACARTRPGVGMARGPLRRGGGAPGSEGGVLQCGQREEKQARGPTERATQNSGRSRPLRARVPAGGTDDELCRVGIGKTWGAAAFGLRAQVYPPDRYPLVPP